MNLSQCSRCVVPLKSKEILTSPPVDTECKHAVRITKDEPSQSSSETPNKSIEAAASDFMPEWENVQSA